MEELLDVNPDAAGDAPSRRRPCDGDDGQHGGEDLAAKDAVLRLRRLLALESIAAVVAERGLPASSVAMVCERASMPRAIFEEMFGSLDGCFSELVDSTLARMTASICQAFDRERHWVDGIVAALEAMVRFLDVEATAARACLLGRAAAGPDALESRAKVMETLKRLIDGVREELPGDAQPPEVMSEAAVLSVLGIMRRRMLNSQAPPFTPLLGELAVAVIAPFLGPEAATQAMSECERRSTAWVQASRPAHRRAEVLEMLCHAASHRMRACLLHLGEHPGASNRAIGAAIGVSHDGQTSTLLSRLHDAGLLIKREAGSGLPNAWSLSQFGLEIARALTGLT